MKKYIILIVIIISLCLAGQASAAGSGFYQSFSTWYEPVPENPTLNSHSADYVAALNNGTFAGRSSAQWGLPIFHAIGGESTITVAITAGGSVQSYIESNHWNDVPIPVGAEPAGNDSSCSNTYYYRDGHMVIISQDGETAWDFFQAEHCITSDGKGGEANKADPTSGYWRAKTVRKIDLKGNGIIYPYDGHGTQRVVSTPLLQGVLTYAELAAAISGNEIIPHVLAFYHDATLTGNTEQNLHFYPDGLTTGQGYKKDGAWTVQPGMRFQLDPSFDCDTVTNTFERIVCKTLQTYGMIFVDSCGDNANYLEMEELSNDVDGRTWAELGVTSAVYPNSGFTQINESQLRLIDPLTPPFSDQPQCSNGVDDDLDGLFDWPADVDGCTNAADNSEINSIAPPHLQILNTPHAVIKNKKYKLLFDLPQEEGYPDLKVSFLYDLTGTGCTGTAITACTDLLPGQNAECIIDTISMATGKYFFCGITSGGANVEIAYMPHSVNIFECTSGANTLCVPELKVP